MALGILFLPLPCLAVEVELGSIAPASGVVERVARKVSSALGERRRASAKGLLGEVKSKVFEARTKLGSRSLRRPIDLNLSLTAKPKLLDRSNPIERDLTLRAISAAAIRDEAEVEIILKLRNERESSILMLYKLSF